MRLIDIAETTFSHLVGRILRRALGVALLAIFAVIAFYYASAAGTLALSIEYGLMYAYMIMGAAYAAAALIVLIVLWATRTKPLTAGKTAADLASARNIQIAMLIEAVMLGYSMARKSGKSIS